MNDSRSFANTWETEFTNELFRKRNNISCVPRPFELQHLEHIMVVFNSQQCLHTPFQSILLGSRNTHVYQSPINLPRGRPLVRWNTPMEQRGSLDQKSTRNSIQNKPSAARCDGQTKTVNLSRYLDQIDSCCLCP